MVYRPEVSFKSSQNKDRPTSHSNDFHNRVDPLGWRFFSSGSEIFSGTSKLVPTALLLTETCRWK